MEDTMKGTELVAGDVQEQETQIVRDNKGKFIKGAPSPNPKGRPKKEYSLTTIVNKMMEERHNGNMTKAEALLNTLFEIAIEKKDVSAIKEIFERWAGKSKAFMEIDNTISFTVSENAWGDALEGEAEDIEELEEGDEESTFEVQTLEDSS